MDWLDQLSSLRDSLPEGEDTLAQETIEPEVKSPRLDIVFEKKGRAGKQATIVCGFECDDVTLKDIASKLKKTLGCGGSARDGEILIQGDRRQDTLKALAAMGFKARII
ncbi:MAG: translation initiation factor [Paramuribaculum sp.]|nr:translation initiation factor [Paramuribaculum sp.]MDE6460297.1 translation initiation factor [Paramuribaculum sp.]MDE6652608.1 translation initiation factor [Paramuribaculum sp.]